jgi:cell division protein FtsI (penicillin-binding protein 3)
MKSRVIFLFSCFLILWSMLLMRAMFLQIFPDGRLENLKRKQFETSLQIRTRRGAILDRNGKELAASVPAYSLFVDPKMVRDPIILISRLSKFLDVSKATLRKRLMGDRTRRFVWVRRQLNEKQRDEIKKWGEPGLGFIEEPRRVYPNGALLSQVLGFVGSEGDGLEGLELQFNKNLEGRLKSILLPRDARGRPLLEDGRSLSEVPDGSDLELTIDHEVQFTLENELASVVDKFEADAAVGLVLDAHSSEILALANLPNTSRRNHVVTDAFEPGSTMKTFVIAAGLRENLLKPSTTYFCENGRMKVGDRWISEADAHHRFGNLTVTEILANSSNIGSAKIAFDVGEERLYKTLVDFGFGSKLGLELPGEARGILNPLPWRQHLFSNVAFGHGISVTPLQLAAAYAAIANGGVLKRPLLVRSIRKPGKDEPQLFHAEELRRVLTPGEAATMRLMLSAATEAKATGANARINGYYVGGKTGTAQKVDTSKGGYIKNAYISSFAGFVPANDPRYVIFVAVDNPRKSYYGSQVAAPIFAKIAQYMVRRAGVPPMLISESHVIQSQPDRARSQLQSLAVDEIRRAQITAAAPGPQLFPDLEGLTLREALNRIRGNVNRIDIRGHGLVVKTVPPRGADFSKKRDVRLILDNP